MKRFIAVMLASAMLTGTLCACSDSKDNTSSNGGVASPAMIEEEQAEYDVKIWSLDTTGAPTSLDVKYEYVDGEDSVEVYYISFSCDVDGLSVERMDENFNSIKTLYHTESIKTTECFKLTTTVPEGMPNTRISVVCGENEYRYQLQFNGRDGGALLTPEN